MKAKVIRVDFKKFQKAKSRRVLNRGNQKLEGSTATQTQVISICGKILENPHLRSRFRFKI